MKKSLITSFLVLGLLNTACFAEEQGVLKTENDKISYSVGFQLGENFKKEGTSLNTEFLFKGVEDALADATPLLTPDERHAALTSLQKQLGEIQQQKIKVVAEKNLAISTEFLAANAKKEGVTTLPSGLQYKEITSGSGKTPKADDKVTVHYTGKLLNGSEFDSSHRRNKPSNFQVDKVIKGWTEALQLMQEGDKWQIYIPPELAYGARGAAGGRIPANSTLIFDVELISVD